MIREQQIPRGDMRGVMTVAEFEGRVPTTARVERMRLEGRKVLFATGYDQSDTLFLLWDRQGRAFGRLISELRGSCDLMDRGHVVGFNGRLYMRSKTFDLNSK